MTENQILMVIAIAQTLLMVPPCFTAVRDLVRIKEKRGKASESQLTRVFRRLALPAMIIFTLFSWGAVAVNHRQMESGYIDFDAVDKKWVAYEYKLESGKRFNNETVRLDGKRFVDCVFTNTTLEFEGNAPFSMEGETYISGTVTVRSDNPIVKQTIKLMLAHSSKSLKETPEKIGK
jgi:hypothetical protein